MASYLLPTKGLPASSHKLFGLTAEKSGIRPSICSDAKNMHFLKTLEQDEANRGGPRLLCSEYHY